VRIGLFKRLSSSGHSFILSLQRQRARNELFIHAIDHKLPIPLGSFTDKQINVTDEDIETDGSLHGSVDTRYKSLAESLPPKTKWVNTTVFKPTLRRDLVKDTETITWLLERFGDWDSTRDSKINALVDLLTNDHPGEKVLVFTEYSDTADYVAAALTDAGIANVALATGDIDNPAEIARRFSPNSNRLPSEDPSIPVDIDRPVDVLVATDVLSEGQNLQDSHIIVNYDLPWAIIRIIQRAGRVDRIGQKSDTVNLYLITHENIEEQIQLRQRIKHRLGAAAEAFGSDEKFFGGDKEIKILDDLYKGKVSEDDSDDEAEVDSVSEAWLVWSNAQDKHPQITARVLRLQDMIHSTRDQYMDESHGGVTCYISTGSGVDAFATATITDHGVQERILTPLEALRIFRAEPTTPTAPLRPDHFDRETALVKGPLKTETVAAGNLKGVRKWAWQRLGGTVFGEKASSALDALHARPLTEHANMRLSQARRNKYSLDDLADLINQLHDEDRLVIGATDTDTIKIVCSLGVTSS
jgi:hypothetical protein